MDWGILDGGQDGNQTMRRIYWANKSTSIVADEAAEAMLILSQKAPPRESGATDRPTEAEFGDPNHRMRVRTREAMLHPDLWGHVLFTGRAAGDALDAEPERFMRDDEEEEDDLLELEL